MTMTMSKYVFAAAAAVFAGTAMAAQPPAKTAAESKTFVQTIEGVDISGTWAVDGYVPSGRPTEQKMLRPLDGGDVPLQPWAEAIYKDRIARDKSTHPFMNTSAYCLPLGMPAMMLGATYPFLILQTPGLITTVHEEGHVHRLIYLNRPHSPDPDPGYLGESVAHWEGDTLVVDTIGLNDKTTLDFLGIPHSDKLHIVERIRRIAPDKLENVMTFEDREAFTRPWRFRRTYSLQKPGVYLAEYFCQDGQRSVPDRFLERPAAGNATPSAPQ